MHYIQTFVVAGRGVFPFDMLRYDRCWPAREDQAWVLGTGSDGVDREIELKRYVLGRNKEVPTLDRWKSFGWQVVPGTTEERKIT